MKTSMNLEHVYTHTQTCASTRARTHTHTRSEIRHKLPQLLLIIYFRLVATCNLYNIIYIYISDSTVVLSVWAGIVVVACTP